MLYYSGIKAILEGSIDLTADTIKCALIASTYTPDRTDALLSDVSAHQVSGTGYTAGGFTLSSKTFTISTVYSVFDAADYLYAELAAACAFRYIVIYDDSVTNDPLIACIDFGADNPAPNDGLQYSISWNEAGIFRFFNSDDI